MCVSLCDVCVLKFQWRRAYTEIVAKSTKASCLEKKVYFRAYSRQERIEMFFFRCLLRYTECIIAFRVLLGRTLELWMYTLASCKCYKKETRIVLLFRTFPLRHRHRDNNKIIVVRKLIIIIIIIITIILLGRNFVGITALVCVCAMINGGAVT